MSSEYIERAKKEVQEDRRILEEWEKSKFYGEADHPSAESITPVSSIGFGARMGMGAMIDAMRTGRLPKQETIITLETTEEDIAKRLDQIIDDVTPITRASEYGNFGDPERLEGKFPVIMDTMDQLKIQAASMYGARGGEPVAQRVLSEYNSGGQPKQPNRETRRAHAKKLKKNKKRK